MEKGHWHRYAMWILMALMILRGAGLMFITASPERAKQDFGAQVYQAADENWSSTILLGKYIMPFDKTDLKEPVELNIGEWKEYRGSVELTSGTLVVTGAYPFALAEELPNGRNLCRPTANTLWDNPIRILYTTYSAAGSGVVPLAPA